MAHEYIHLQSIGNLEKCRQEVLDIGKFLNDLYEKREIMGYEIRVVKDQNEADENFILSEFGKVTSNRFPFVFAAIEFSKTPKLDLDSIMRERDYQKIGEI